MIHGHADIAHSPGIFRTSTMPSANRAQLGVVSWTGGNPVHPSVRDHQVVLPLVEPRVTQIAGNPPRDAAAQVGAPQLLTAGRGLRMRTIEEVVAQADGSLTPGWQPPTHSSGLRGPAGEMHGPTGETARHRRAEPAR
jgi:hypothetical protein